MVFLTLITAKLIFRILRFFGLGATTLPGRIALKMKYNILNKLSQGVEIICITGTNGKTTTCALVEHALNAEGCSYFINKSGANMISGVATSFIENCTVFGRCKKEYAILECDENSFPEISRYLDAKIVAVTNIFRDQLDRYGETETTLNTVLNAINNMPDAVLILNADCPLTYSISEKCENLVKTFGINANYKLKYADDNRFCPLCKRELIYKTKIYAQLGDYFCPGCAYKRVYPDVCAEEITALENGGSSFLINTKNGRMSCSISLGGIYNVYNYCCAVAILKTLGIDYKSLNSFSGAFGRMERFFGKGFEVLMLLVKNPVGLSNCINYACEMNNDVNMVFALNDNEADSTDVSWIWDSSFVKIKSSTASFITVGIRAYDMALRLKYDGIDVDSIIDGEDYESLISMINKSKRNTVIFANYTAMMNMRKYFVRSFGGKEFWE
ncbi:MAG: DUF1727 domain-containing protein [Ruminococcaceae bacterium]|nr:DUF1727 domain-containing protein [Oscillospiraceae bacterium]